MKNQMSVTDFAKGGYLQEVNRLFLHPLGMALVMQVDEETGERIFTPYIQKIDDPDGLLFHDFYLPLAKKVSREIRKASLHRIKELGFCIQPYSMNTISKEMMQDTNKIKREVGNSVESVMPSTGNIQAINSEGSPAPLRFSCNGCNYESPIMVYTCVNHAKSYCPTCVKLKSCHVCECILAFAKSSSGIPSTEINLKSKDRIIDGLYASTINLFVNALSHFTGGHIPPVTHGFLVDLSTISSLYLVTWEFFVEKGLATRKDNPLDKTEIFFHLTELGIEIFIKHKRIGIDPNFKWVTVKDADVRDSHAERQED